MEELSASLVDVVSEGDLVYGDITVVADVLKEIGDNLIQDAEDQPHDVINITKVCM